MFNSLFAGVPAVLAARGSGSSGFIVGPIAKLLGFFYDILFNLIYSFTETGSLVLAIILFTLIIKVILMPLTYNQLKGTYRMQKLQPEMNKIRAKYAGKTDEDSQRRLQFELQEFQRENGASSFAGCLPMLIQLPILYALYYIFNQPYEYVGVINEVYSGLANGLLNIDAATRVDVLTPVIQSLNVTQTSFDVSLFDDVLTIVKNMSDTQWSTLVSSLGTLGNELTGILAQKQSIEYFFGLNLVSTAGLRFPGIIVPICAGFTTFLSTWYMTKRQQQMTGGGDSQAEQMTKTMNTSMNIVMPIMMGVITINVPVALGVYWSLSNLFSIVQTWLIYKTLGKRDAEGRLVYKEKKDKNKKEQKQSTIVDRNKFNKQ